METTFLKGVLCEQGLPVDRARNTVQVKERFGLGKLVSIAVVGSINMDIVNHVHRHPQPGETIHGLGTEYSPGGKGANQAVAASLAGGKVTMVGAVGTDAFGGQLSETLKGFGVDTSHLRQKEGTSGLAFITVDDSGENNIILSAGSNGKVTEEDVRATYDALPNLDIVLLQNEIPWETTEFAMREAKARGIRVFFNPAPAIKVEEDILVNVDTLVLNETEARVITDIPVQDPSQAKGAAEQLVRMGVRAVLITLGEQGAVYSDADGKEIHTPAFSVTPVDTTAAGDTFIGAFAVASVTESSIEEALTYATASSAITVTRKGAQGSIPTRAEVTEFLRVHSQPR